MYILIFKLPRIYENCTFNKRISVNIKKYKCKDYFDLSSYSIARVIGNYNNYVLYLKWIYTIIIATKHINMKIQMKFKFN